ncbi:hypothetical protein ZIOFF_061436 [Zingiber officinale]|uniref:Trehalose 6-phosphate phosphatase n=1 Tax=Zingiber officinale TaxID=94328 RepID=A0A8J5KEK3_ZINOF|nr:hypothetical protein ZIOFF_061436 [Zingiber officinale]
MSLMISAQRQHPSALVNFDDIVATSKGKRIMREAVRDVARHFPTAIVSGRCRDKVFNFVQLRELYYAGSHGMDIKGPSKQTKRTNSKDKSVSFQPASEHLPMIDEVYKTLVEKTNSISGSRIENNKFTLSVHFRCVDEKKWSSLTDQVRAVVKDYPQLTLTVGRKVLEIRPTIKWDKGKALEFLLESLGFADCSNVFPVYIGDDNTDEDAFRVLHERGQGVGILVSKVAKKTKASFSLRDPTEAVDDLFVSNEIKKYFDNEDLFLPESWTKIGEADSALRSLRLGAMKGKGRKGRQCRRTTLMREELASIGNSLPVNHFQGPLRHACQDMSAVVATVALTHAGSATCMAMHEVKQQYCANEFIWVLA